MRIGLFVDAYIPEINGVVTATKTLSDALIAQGEEVFVITTNPFSDDIILEDNVVRIPGIELKKLYGYRVANPYSKKAEKIVKSLNLQVIHVQTELSIGIFGRLFAKKYDIPLVYTYHTMYYDYTYYFSHGVFDPVIKGIVKKGSKWLASLSTEFVTTSIKTKNALRSYQISQYINVIPNGINLKQFDKSQFDKEEFIKYRKDNGLEGKYLLLSVGRIAKEKSLDMCIRQFAKYVNETHDDNIAFLIVGDGPQKEECERLSIELGMLGKIRFIGKVLHEETPFYYALCDLYISASTSETQGLTFIEAQASGLPVICHYDDNLNDVIIDNKTGFFFYSENECFDKLNYVIHLSSESRNEIINNAYENIKKYSVEKFSNSMKEVYYRAIRKRW